MLSEIQILVVEDDPIMRKLVRDMLRVMDFTNVRCMSDGRKALEYLQRNEPDILITDWRMEHIDGLSLTQHIRFKSGGINRFMPIIMFTGQGERKHVEMARDAGVTEYIVKPFTSKTLFDRIQSVIETPRNFIVSKEFRGPDRRRRGNSPPDGSFKRRSDKSKR